MTGGQLRQAERAAAGAGLTLHRAAWLSDEVLVLHCVRERLTPGGAEPGNRDAWGGEHHDGTRTVAVKAFVTPLGTLLAAPVTPRSLARLDRLTFVEEGEGEGEALAAEAGVVRGALTDLRTLLREGPAAWDADARTALLGSLAALGREHGLSRSLSDGLRQAREALRERRPVTIADRRAERGVVVERLHRVDAETFYIRGRAWDVEGPITALAAMTPEGERVELADRVLRDPRLDPAFIGLFETTTPTRSPHGWVVDAASGPARAVETSADLGPDVLHAILADAALDLGGAEELLLERHVHPAVTRINARRRASVAVADVETYGAVPRSPATSLVIPLQRRIDLIEHQLAQFAADADLVECELLYVLDDPERHDLLREVAAGLFALYGLPFRVATLTEAGGYPIACNLGASIASASRLVLLQGDVLPDRPGWISAMGTALETGAGTGAVAPKLLYEDQTIDAAALDYSKPNDRSGWLVDHRYRGLHRRLAAANRGGPVRAVGAACVMVDAAAFRDVGGLSSEYGHAAYEGSDLSRRLAEAGRDSRYAPEAELYRLEGLGANAEPPAERYAHWLHGRLWADAIEGAVSRR
jgi:O-antigen biosynthesis protein